MNCACCDASLTSTFTTSHLALNRCSRCGTYQASHSLKLDTNEPWNSTGVTEVFKESLRTRREIQSKQIIGRFDSVLRSERILDYGCGQGAFVTDLAARGFNAAGCDLSRSVTGTIARDRFVALETPWSLPDPFDYRVVILLDVLEHHTDPLSFLATMREKGAKHLLVKVPLADGPTFRAARLMCLFKADRILEKLFLVGDVFPHQFYFTAAGLKRLAERAGYHYQADLPMADFGRELPSRIRSVSRPVKILKPFISLMGWTAEMISPAWPDTRVFQFDLN